MGANSMAMSELVLRSDLVGTGRAISVLFSLNGIRNKRSHLVGPPFPAFKARFSATAGWHSSRNLGVSAFIYERVPTFVVRTCAAPELASTTAT